MTEHQQTVQDQQKLKRRLDTKAATIEPLPRQIGTVGQAELFGRSFRSVDTQATRLGDARLQTAQRQALATQIGRVQGNQHLQRVVASLKRDEVVVEQAKPRPGTVIQLKPT